MSYNWEEFGALVLQRRKVELGLTQEEVANRGGPSNATMTKLEKGLGVKVRTLASTLRKLEEALDWEPGSAIAGLQGGRPKPLRTSPVTEIGQSDQPLAELWSQWNDLESRANATVLEYASRRGIGYVPASRELQYAADMSKDAVNGGPWVPPWHYPDHFSWLHDYYEATNTESGADLSRHEREQYFSWVEEHLGPRNSFSELRVAREGITDSGVTDKETP